MVAGFLFRKTAATTPPILPYVALPLQSQCVLAQSCLDFMTLWTLAHQATLPMEFSSQGYRSNWL